MIEKLTQDEAFIKLPMEVQETILKYAKPCIGFDSAIAKAKLETTSSKLGGVPYFAKGEDIPRNENNVPYFMVVQLNFEEIKNEAGQHPDLPETGLLQIFINALDPNYGLVSSNDDPDNPSPQVVRFYEKVPTIAQCDEALTEEYNQFFYSGCDFYATEKALSDKGVGWDERQEKMKELPFFVNYGKPYFPVIAECKLSFKAELSLPKPSSIDIEFNEGEQLWESIGEAGKSYLSENCCQHRLVGYIKAWRTGDPRHLWGFVEGVPEELRPFLNKRGDVIRNDLQVFLELDSDYQKPERAMSWWDSAQAHFLIKHTDLEKHNFSNMQFSVEA